MKEITEKDGIHQAWYDEWPVTVEDLAAFITKLTTEYHHDSGTIVHAIAAAAVAAGRCVNASPASRGGITGFQAQAVFWQFYTAWDAFLVPKDSPAWIGFAENLLYPQYKDRFRSISPKTWEWVQKRAAERLAESGPASEIASNSVVEHWKSIVAGKVPFGFEVRE